MPLQQMQKRFVWFALFVLLASSAAAETLADYPRMLFAHGAPTIVAGKGDTSQIVAVNLVALDLWRYATFSGKARQRVNVVEPGKNAPGRDEVVIGTPCGNARVRELMNIPSGKCNQIFTHGTPLGRLILYQDDFVHIVVTGNDGEGVLNAAKVLVNGNARQQLNRTSVPVMRMQRVVNRVARGGTFLSIGQTLGAAVVYGQSSTIVRSTTLPEQDCPVVTRTLTSGETVQLHDCRGTVFYGGVPTTTRNVNVLGTPMWLSAP